MKLFWLTIILLNVGGIVMAQNVLFYPHFRMAFPTDELKEALPQGAVGVGFGTGLAVSLGYESSFYVGADFNYQLYGKTVVDNAERRPVTRRKYDAATETYTTEIIIEDVDFVINNNFINGLFFLRWRPQWETKVVPYLDVVAGGTYFYTHSKLRADAFKQLNKNTYASDLTYSYGFGGGLNLMLGENVGIDIGARYLRGGLATFISKDDITIITKKDTKGDEYSAFEYKTRSAPYNMIVGHLGFIFLL